MKTKKRKRRLKKKVLVFLLLFLCAFVVSSFLYLRKIINDNKTSVYFLAADDANIELFDKDGQSLIFTRGMQVDIKNKKMEVEDIQYNIFEYNGKTYLVEDKNLELDRNNCVKEDKLYALRDHVLTAEYDDYHIRGWVKENQELTVNGYHNLLEDGSVDYYYVNNSGYISSKYVAKQFYVTYLDASIYKDVYFGDGGNPQNIRYYAKEEYECNMPEKVNALYINAGAVVNADRYIALARQTSGINAFVVDIKDCYHDTQLAYDSDVAYKYAPSTDNIPNSFETYQENVKKLKDAGYYLIGRITAFKDDAFAKDNPEESLMYNGSLYSYGSVKWPSIYSRKMWEYDVALAIEAVEQMGFDEIQFDYIRLPEDVEDVDLRNIYDESRAQAVTNFLRYATEYLHARNINVSADVFGETSGSETDRFSCFVSYYGQFWPAVSNAVDAISSMPYPDHFAPYAYGIEAPWAQPGDIMYAWARATYYAQEKTYDKAKCRTWIMAQNSDPYDVTYGVDFIADQIRALRRADIDDGYLTWNAGSSTYKYEEYVSALD